MSKTKLDFEYDYNFLLIGISSHVKDYRLSWHINNKLGISLKKEKNLTIVLKNSNELEGISHYSYRDEENHLSYAVVSNRGSNGFLIQEYRQTDFFLIIEGFYQIVDEEQLLNHVREIDVVLAAFSINPAELKSRQNLLFDQ